jgi:hypothetical protein
VQGGSANGSTSGNGGAVTITGGTAAATAGSLGGAVTISGGAGTSTGTGAAGSAVTINGGAAGGSGNNAGGGLTVTTGAGTGSGSGGAISVTSAAGGASAGAGGNITVTAGNGGGGNANGGNIQLTAGNATGSGTPGVVSIDTPVFTAVTESAFSSNSAVTQGDIDNFSTIVVSASNTGLTLTVPAPTNNTTGRIVYITVASGSQTFTLSPSGGPSIYMSPNTTSQLVWNSAAGGWTAGAAGNSLQAVYNNTTASPASIVTTSSTKNILLQAGVGFDNANLFQIGNSLGAQSFTVDTTNTASSTNLAQNTGGETAGPSGWTAYIGSGTPTVSQTAVAGEYASGAAGVKVHFATAISGGVDNALNSAALATSATVYNVTFSIKAGTSAPTNANMVVEYYRATGTLDSTCTTAPSPAITTTAFTKFTCTFTSSGNTKQTTNFLRIRVADAVIRDLYIDNLALIAQTSGTQNVGNVSIGGINSQGLTLITLDSYASNPFTGTSNTALLGSMYYDTTAGRIQCYESDGWGSCGASPNNTITLTPEYTGAVLNSSLNAASNGTMTANLCANSGTLSSGSVIQPDASLCGSGQIFNYYKWTTTQSTSQLFDIFVRYTLPTTFRSFTGNLTMTARTSSTANGVVTGYLYGYDSGHTTDGTLCGTGVDLTTSGGANVWSTGNLATSSCNFQAGDTIMFRVGMSSKSSAFVYASNITFTMTGK